MYYMAISAFVPIVLWAKYILPLDSRCIDWASFKEYKNTTIYNSKRASHEHSTTVEEIQIRNTINVTNNDSSQSEERTQQLLDATTPPSHKGMA